MLYTVYDHLREKGPFVTKFTFLVMGISKYHEALSIMNAQILAVAFTL